MQQGIIEVDKIRLIQRCTFFLIPILLKYFFPGYTAAHKILDGAAAVVKSFQLRNFKPL